MTDCQVLLWLTFHLLLEKIAIVFKDMSFEEDCLNNLFINILLPSQKFSSITNLPCKLQKYEYIRIVQGEIPRKQTITILKIEILIASQNSKVDSQCIIRISSYEKLSKTGTNLAVTRALRNAKNVATLGTMCILSRNTEYVPKYTRGVN